RGVGLGGNITSEWSYARTPVLDGGGAVSFWYRNVDETGTLPGTLSVDIREEGGEWVTIDSITNILTTDHCFHMTELASEAEDLEVQILWSGSNNVTEAPLAIDNFTVEHLGPHVTFSGMTNSPASPLISDLVEVSVDLSVVNHATNVTLRTWYRIGTNGLFSSTSMTEIVPGTYRTDPAIPRGEPGVMQYYVEAAFNSPLGGDTLYAYSPAGGGEVFASYTLTDTNIGETITFQEDQGWAYSGYTLSTQTNAQWTLTDGYIVGRSETLGIAPLSFFSARAAALVNTEDQGGTNSNLRSPYLPLGVGVISFDAFSKNLSSVDVELQLSSNGVDGWQTIETVTTYSADLWTEHVIDLQVEEPTFLRFFKPETTGDNQFLGLDNIEIVYPSAHVAISNVTYSPHYPADSESVQISCDIASAGTFAPALDITARVYHRRLGETNYTADPVEMTGNGTHFVTATGIPAYASEDTVEYYVECTFRGYNNVLQFSPTYSPSDAPASAYHYSVRAHESSYGSFEIGADGGTFSMTQVGDGDWLGVLNIASVTNDIAITVEGDGYFDGTNVFDGIPIPWGDSSQAATPPPYFGHMQQSGTNVVLSGEVDGQYVLEFNELTGEYTLRRGAYQDFNTWPAEENFFEYSLNVVDLVQYNADFDNTNDWPKSVAASAADSFDVAWTNVPPEYPPTNGAQSGITSPDLPGSSRYVIGDAQIIPQIVGQAAMLDDRATYGFVRTRNEILHQGVGTFQFDVRCVDDDPAPAMLDLADYFDDAAISNTTNIIVQVRFSASAIPNSTESTTLGYCYLSFYLHYVDATHYYELKYVQRPSNKRRLELWKCNGGDPWRLRASGDYDHSITTADSIALLFYRNATGTSKLRVFRNNGTQAIRAFTDGGAITDGTTIGISGMDADIDVHSVLVYTTGDLNHFNRGGTLIYSDASHGRGDWDDGGNPWTISSSDFTRPGFTGGSLGFTVDYIRDEDVEFGNVDASPWTTAGAYSSYSNTAYTRISQTVARPEDLFVRVQHTSGDGHLVIDNIQAHDWHGEDFSPTNGWRASEAWVTTDSETIGGTNVLELSTSRAYTDVVQRVRSPLLPNGAATIEFDYRRTSIDSNELVLAIEHSTDATTNTWVSLMVTNAPEDWSSFTWRLPTESSTNAMYIRIRNASTNWNSGAYINNIRITEPIPLDSETWRGYNVLVTPNLPDKRLPEVGNIKGAYINNHPSNDTDGVEYTEAWPFIETPLLAEGVGEVSFSYRAWDSSPSQIEVVASNDRNLPDVQWTPLHTLYNVTNQTFQSFRQHFYERNYDYVRLRIRTDEGYGRACIDNLLVAAPFGASVKVRDVELSPEIPLHTDEVLVTATVYDHFLNPSNISLRTYYQLGTNDWGAYNAPYVRPMIMISNTETTQTYQTTVPIGQNGSNAIDTVVQYYVQAEFDGFFSEQSSPVRHKEFENPEHYWPVDHNANQSSNTPYYVVFSCLPKQVWINELNVADGYVPTPPYISPQQYVELCGLAGVDISGWKLNTFNVDDTNVTADASYTIETVPPTRVPNDTNAFGFFVFGKDAVVEKDMVLTNDLETTGGIHLVRSMGAVEHSICYETIPDDLNRAVTNNQEYRFVFVGTDDDYEDGALYATGTGSNGTDFAENWGLATAWLYSPGEINDGQTLVPWPGTTNEPPVIDYDGALIISGFWMTEFDIHFIVEAETNTLQMTPWYTTNMVSPITWTAGANAGTTVSGNTYTVSCDLLLDTPGCFYKVTTQ
ncbi:MAG: hypothetical protein HN341_01200, partial [Verrucomicrobia bacterium]|nr:hypothetical protein [Verrucomicrobiota bacterium]